jgi:hypothetical protein
VLDAEGCFAGLSWPDAKTIATAASGPSDRPDIAAFS